MLVRKRQGMGVKSIKNTLCKRQGQRDSEDKNVELLFMSREGPVILVASETGESSPFLTFYSLILVCRSLQSNLRFLRLEIH